MSLNPNVSDFVRHWPTVRAMFGDTRIMMASDGQRAIDTLDRAHESLRHVSGVPEKFTQSDRELLIYASALLEGYGAALTGERVKRLADKLSV